MVILNNNLSLCFQKKGKPMDAVKHAKEATELDPKNSKAFYRLFKGYVDNQDLDGALSSIENAVKLEPNN